MAVSAYLFASLWHIDWQTLLELIVGTTLVIASACVWNNIIDSNIDKKMNRTKNRALPSGKISRNSAIFLGSCLALSGFLIVSQINRLTLLTLGIPGFVGYIFFYGWAKRNTVYSTLIGTVPGGASIVAGYTASKDSLDMAALILFLIMVGWQMTHFYSIAIYRVKDYTAAKIPVISVRKGIKTTRRHMIFYLLVFILSNLWLSLSGYSGYVYAVIMLSIGLIWLRKGLVGFKSADNSVWARDMFKFSLVVILVLPLVLSFGSVLP